MLCKYFGKCGGCQLMHLPYKKQLEKKVEKVLELFKKEPEEIIPSPKIYYYRNRMDWAVGKNYEVGLKEYGKWWSYVDIDECFLQSKESNEIKNKFREFIKEKNLEPWNNINHRGFVRYLIVREGKFTKERMITILLSEFKNIEIFNEFIDIIKSNVTSVYIGINKEISDISYSNEKYLIYGKRYLKERILDNNYYILPNSFFQPNSYTLKIMIKKIIDLLDPKKDEIIYDLYGGVGTFSIEIAKYCKEVIGVDVEKEAEELFYLNSKENEIKNTKFILEKVENLKEIIAKKVIIDPPRSGCHPNALKNLIKSDVRKIIYVSCNPETQLRDINFLIKNDYRFENYILIDQFPHTIHIESIAVLEK